MGNRARLEARSNVRMRALSKAAASRAGRRRSRAGAKMAATTARAWKRAAEARRVGALMRVENRRRGPAA